MSSLKDFSFAELKEHKVKVRLLTAFCLKKYATSPDFSAATAPFLLSVFAYLQYQPSKKNFWYGDSCQVRYVCLTVIISSVERSLGKNVFSTHYEDDSNLNLTVERKI